MAVSYNNLWKIMIDRGVSASELRKKIGIAPNTMTRLKKNDEVKISILDKICNVLNCDFGDIMSYIPDKEFERDFIEQKCKIIEINNRRYLGNKYKLLPFITNVVKTNCSNIQSIADIFSGTGAVASAFLDKRIITNDLMFSNYISNLAWFGNDSYDRNKLIRIISMYNSLSIDEENYMTKNFADTYFSRKNCSKIGYIREDIEQRYRNHDITQRERAILITSLLYAMDKVANTYGHYDAFIKGTKFGKEITLCMPDASQTNNIQNECFNEDANELVKKISADLVYIDPPYNSRQYCDAYHLLENVARWEKPEVYGVAKKMDRKSLKSKYCTKEAEAVLRDLVDNINARYILLSYNNMASKGNERSNAKISDKAILETLQQRGKVQVFAESHRPFSAGRSNITDNEERLFLCTCA